MLIALTSKINWWKFYGKFEENHNCATCNKCFAAGTFSNPNEL